jgi:hypothetical protein
MASVVKRPNEVSLTKQTNKRRFLTPPTKCGNRFKMASVTLLEKITENFFTQDMTSQMNLSRINFTTALTTFHFKEK